MGKMELEVVEVKAEELPDLIRNQFQEITSLEKKVNEAIKKADKAKKSADKAKEKSAGLFHKKEAIESLQEATVDLADSQQEIVDAQKLSFAYQQQLAEITKYLFNLGIMSIAANRSVVRELTLQLKGASEKELSELARQEILNVITQLKAQEDIMEKQTFLSKVTKANAQKIETNVQRIESNVEKITYVIEKGKERDEALNKHDELIEYAIDKGEERDEKLQSHHELIDYAIGKGKERDEAIAAQVEKDVEHDNLFQRQAEINHANEQKTQELSATIFQLQQRLDAMSESKAEKKTIGIVMVISIAAVILGLVQFVI